MPLYSVTSSGGGGTPGGSSGQLQYNDAGTFAGAAALVYATSGTLLTGTAQAATDKVLALVAHGSQSANLFEARTSGGVVRARVTSAGDFSNQRFTGSDRNECFGAGAGAGLSSGVINTLIGANAGGSNVTSNVGCTLVGADISYGSAGASNFDTLVGANITRNGSGVASATVFGYGNTVSGDDGVIVGKGLTGIGGTVNIGNSSTVSGAGSVSVGTANSLTNSGCAALGNFCASTQNGEISFGQASVTTTYLSVRSPSDTTNDQRKLEIACPWATATHASRKARAVFNIFDTAAREALRLEASGSAAMIGFLGASAIVRPSGDLATALENLGLITSATLQFSRMRTTPIRPSQITSNQNDYAPTGWPDRRLHVTSDAARSITGMSAASAVDGTEAFILNAGSFDVTLVNESASSSAANRFTINLGTDIILAPNDGVGLYYDATATRWRVFG